MLQLFAPASEFSEVIRVQRTLEIARRPALLALGEELLTGLQDDAVPARTARSRQPVELFDDGRGKVDARACHGIPQIESILLAEGLLRKVKAPAGQVEQFLREWAAVENPPVATRQHIDQFDMKMLWSIYTTLIKPVDGDALKRRLRENLDRLEAFAEVLFRRATRGDARVAAAPRIDVHKLPMDRDRWDEVGLFGGPDRAAMVERIRQDMVALFVDGSVDPDERAAAVTTPASGEPMLVPYAAPAAMGAGGAFDGMV